MMVVMMIIVTIIFAVIVMAQMCMILAMVACTSTELMMFIACIRIAIDVIEETAWTRTERCGCCNSRCARIMSRCDMWHRTWLFHWGAAHHHFYFIFFILFFCFNFVFLLVATIDFLLMYTQKENENWYTHKFLQFISFRFMISIHFFRSTLFNTFHPIKSTTFFGDVYLEIFRSRNLSVI